VHALNFGLKPALQLNSMETLRRMWKLADDGGFDGCWVIDHFAALGPDRTGDVFEAWTTLAAMAEATSRVRVGTMVTGNSHRHPGMLAKMAVTVDHLSGGRLDMGIGAGGDEMVHDMFGMPLGSIRERIESLAEACQILELLWTQPTTSFDGQHYRLTDVVANPKPVQRPHPPLWVAGSGERRSLRVIAEHADVWINANMPGTPAEEPPRRVALNLDGLHAPAKVHGERQDDHEHDDHRERPEHRRSPRALLPPLHEPVDEDEDHQCAEHQPPPRPLLQLVPEPVGAALPFDHVQVTVLGPLAQGDGDPSPPDEEQSQALEEHQQRQQTLASLYLSTAHRQAAAMAVNLTIANVSRSENGRLP
jgi:alkanesulfonate monooxygenase SsuD/methylene tetrahydromethanopterin reductase-like flavin-dependent oxidoreductase (luciferase family)